MLNRKHTNISPLEKYLLTTIGNLLLFFELIYIYIYTGAQNGDHPSQNKNKYGYHQDG
jgi:hypothetical protein